MSDASDRQDRVAKTPNPAANPLQGLLDRIPLVVRMFTYGVSFLCAVLVGLPWLAYHVDVHLPAWHVELGWWRVSGIVLFAAFLATYVWSSYLLSWRGRGAYVEFDPPMQFVASGPFRRVRNPIAASLIGMLLGEALTFSSTGIFLLFLVAMLLAHLQVVLLEEPLLRKRFGQAYVDYLARVPRWLPRPPREDSG
jgi:protein-S-isoprenylcysteine O-methyltransferase Ste14